MTRVEKYHAVRWRFFALADDRPVRIRKRSELAREAGSNSELTSLEQTSAIATVSV